MSHQQSSCEGQLGPQSHFFKKKKNCRHVRTHLNVLVCGDLVENTRDGLGDDVHELEVDVVIIVARRVVARVHHLVALGLPQPERLPGFFSSTC
jgi:hypothetical protein